MHRGENNAMGGMSGHVFPPHTETWLCNSEGFEVLATIV